MDTIYDLVNLAAFHLCYCLTLIYLDLQSGLQTEHWGQQI